MKKRILYIQFANPALYPPLEHSSRILADNGWDVIFLGTINRTTEKLAFTPHERITVTLLPAVSSGWRLKLNYLLYTLWVCLRTILWQPKWVYTSDLLSAPVAFLLKGLLRRRLIYHEHDTPTGPPVNIFISICLIARKWVARNAEIVILPNQERIEYFCKEQKIVKAKVYCVWNCPGFDELNPQRPRSPINNHAIWVLYQGSTVPARLPITVVQALSILPSVVKLRIIGYETVGSIGYMRHFIETARELNCADRIEYLGAMKRSDVLAWSRKSDIGLALMPIGSNDLNMRHMTGASNKPFDSLSCGLPLLISDIPEWRQMFCDPGYALSCNPEDPDSIAAALQWFLMYPDKMREMGERGRQRIAADWHYEKQFTSVLKRMNEN
jgi:glycosyltransferase involved in cell wall biosynthesis